MKNVKPRILLILCPPFWTKLPPLGLAYLATFLKSKGYFCTAWDLNISFFHLAPHHLRDRWLVQSDVSSCDALFDTLTEECTGEIDRIVANIKEQLFTVIGFSVFRSNRTFSIKLAEKIKRAVPGVKIVFGGPETMAHKNASFSLFSEEIETFVDCMVIGEGERGLLTVLEADHNNDTLPFIIDSEEYMDVDLIPSPTYDEFHLPDYERKRALPLLASRGCIRSCAFCAERLLSKTFRMRSPENLIHEIEEHMHKENVLWFTFHDSLINGNLKILREFCTVLCNRNIHIKWEAQAAIRDDLDIDLLRLMKEAGCFNLFIGLESGSDHVLKLMNKGYTTREAQLFFKKCHTAGLHCEVSIIVGFPGEGEEEFYETVTFLRENKEFIPKVAQINPFVPYPGTTVAYVKESGSYGDTVSHHYSLSLERVQNLVHYLKEDNVIFTPSFVNNLVYEK